MKDRKGFTLIELLVVITIIAILAAILFPVFASARKSALKSTCQSNMKQLGTAFKSYLADWDDTFPSNRSTIGNTSNLSANISKEVKLNVVDYSSQDQTNDNYRPCRYGPNWVEGLYPYTESTTVKDKSSWKCPAASDSQFGSFKTGTANDSGDKDVLQNTYVMNSFVVEQIESCMNDTSTLMLCREMDRRVGALLRPSPIQASQSVSKSSFKDAFLDGSDTAIKNQNTKLHGSGSNILFADGHVKMFPVDAMRYSQIDYDSTYKQWYNSISSNDSSVKRAIALTP